MGQVVAKQVSKNLARPDSGPFGWLVARKFLQLNKVLEVNAVKVCDIQPDDKVLEVGFGPGLGLQAAYKRVKDGKGEVHGIEISERMLKMAEGSLSQEILAKKVQLKFCSVEKLPYDPNYFDKIFHVNCYYFWPDLDMAMQELQRVIKPQGKLVTTLNLERLKEVKSKNMMQCGNFDPDRYMKALERNGFTNIKMADIKDKIAFQSITATANKN